ncbi:unnamed protein product [Durusdinium trenchii]|uniref:Transmembrane protein n=1 Tax=Durusdinium trenchii TaxID=1381693 RepID=A0ABP0SUA6_9DINO
MEPLPSRKRREGQHDGVGERPSKRRRLSEASILCMRELFRTVVNDGDISEDKRILLQNAGVLLSQVDGKTWVSFPDTQGELQELSPQQLRQLRPFLDQVAEELKTQEVQLLSESSAGSETFDCLELERVPWADGITARELLACCSPDEALHFQTHWLEVLIRILPSKYMLKSRVKKLVNFYYVQGFRPQATTPTRAPRPMTSTRHVRVLRRGVHVLLRHVQTAVQIGRAVAGNISRVVAQLVVLMAAWSTGLFSRLMRLMPFSETPAWPLARLFFAVLLQGQIKKFLELIVLIARLRVILCLARSSHFFGFLFFPFVLIAQKVLGWNEGSWLLGCSCDASGRTSLLSMGPVRAAEGLMSCFKAVRLLPTLPGLAFLATVVDPFVEALLWVQPAVVFLSDLIFSVGFAEGLAMIVRSVDRSAHHKLVWMSMNVGRMLREGPKSSREGPISLPDEPRQAMEWRVVLGSADPLNGFSLCHMPNPPVGQERADVVQRCSDETLGTKRCK